MVVKELHRKIEGIITQKNQGITQKNKGNHTHNIFLYISIKSQ